MKEPHDQKRRTEETFINLASRSVHNRLKVYTIYFICYNIIMKLLKTCTFCLISFFMYPSNSKETKNPFCSMKCYGSWQKNKTYKELGKKERKKTICKYPDCVKFIQGQGYCRYHYHHLVVKLKRPVKILVKKPTLPLISCLKCAKLTKNKKYCSHKCFGVHTRKPFIIKKGYKKILIIDHPRADKKGYVFEHIVTMEKEIGRHIKFPEEVHHIDKNRGNNNISNLLLCKDHKEHMQYHRIKHQSSQSD